MSLQDYADNMHKRTLARRAFHSTTAVRRSRWTNQGGDPRNTAENWYWQAARVLIPLFPR